jgi:hypothetical protein
MSKVKNVALAILAVTMTSTIAHAGKYSKATDFSLEKTDRSERIKICPMKRVCTNWAAPTEPDTFAGPCLEWEVKPVCSPKIN